MHNFVIPRCCFTENGLSVYDMKNNFCLFDRPFKIQNNGLPVLKYLFSFQRYWRFSIIQIRSVMTSYCLQLKSGKILNKRYLWKHWSSVLETWHHNCASQNKKMTPLKLLPWQQFCRWCCLNKNWNFQFLS